MLCLNWIEHQTPQPFHIQRSDLYFDKDAPFSINNKNVEY
jgi:hypothetical protein